MSAIKRDPKVCSGKAVLRGTRFSVASLLAELAEGTESANAIAEDFDLDPALVREALEELAWKMESDRPALL